MLNFAGTRMAFIPTLGLGGQPRLFLYSCPIETELKYLSCLSASVSYYYFNGITQHLSIVQTARRQFWIHICT